MCLLALLGPCPAVSSTYSSYHSKLWEASVLRAFWCLNLPARPRTPTAPLPLLSHSTVSRAFLCLNLPVHLPACPHTPTAPVPLLHLLHSVQRLHPQGTADASSLHFTAPPCLPIPIPVCPQNLTALAHPLPPPACMLRSVKRLHPQDTAHASSLHFTAHPCLPTPITLAICPPNLTALAHPTICICWSAPQCPAPTRTRHSRWSRGARSCWGESR